MNNFAIQSSSYQYLINPSVTNIANVQVINEEVLLLETYADPLNHFYAYSPSIELVGTRTYYKGYTIDGIKILPGLNKAVIRVTVKVTPNNGAPASTIIKTFMADIVL